MKLSIHIKLFLSHFLTILMVSGSIGSYFYHSAQENLMQSLRSRLRNSAALISRDFKVEDLEHIQTREDMGNPLYTSYTAKIREVVATNPDIAFIYIMRKDGDTIRFVIDSDPVPAPPGEVYPETIHELLEGFIRPSVDKTINSDKWGHFLSGYSPLKNGQGRYLIGIDMRADEVRQKFVNLRLMGMLSLLLSLVLATVFSFYLSRHFTGRIDRLMDQCSAIADENPSDAVRTILPATGDELDMLTSAFDRMAINLEASRELNNQTHNKLLTAKENLETRVRERTRDLEAANQKLTVEIRERERMETILEQTARTDYLTSLLNRRAMMHRLEQSVSRYKRNGRAFCLVMLDIDWFKNVNDTYGHPAGDKLLIHVADYLKYGIRETDEISRWGGEEFLILLPETSLKDAVDQANRLREGLAGKKFSIDGNTLKVSASFGVDQYQGEFSLNAYLNRVDTFLYKAKTLGRNRVVSLTC